MSAFETYMFHNWNITGFDSRMDNALKHGKIKTIMFITMHMQLNFSFNKPKKQIAKAKLDKYCKTQR